MAFDIERYKLRSEQLDLSDIRWDDVSRYPLRRGAVDAMLYMMDIESHTAIYLSELLVSKACMDPVITSFLSIWAYEEMYHGDAFARFLRAYGITVDNDRATVLRRADTRGRIAATLTILFGSYALPFFPAIYLTIGATNELTTLTGYQRLIDYADHPVLTQLLRKIAKQERMHYAFYRSQAESHLLRNAAARRATRWFVQKRMRIVGEGVKSTADVDQFAYTLFAGKDGRIAARHIDRTIAELPGLQGVNLMERMLDRAAARSPHLAAVDWNAPVVVAPLLADPTDAAYLAKTPVG
jgi:hypothetical protein